MKKLIFLFSFIFSVSVSVFCQTEVDIVPYLKQIETGSVEDVKASLTKLKLSNPLSVNLIFLEAVVTENGQEAVSIYDRLVKEHPDNKYADASLYRIYSYYYALGLYETAKTYKQKLQKDYPSSPYIKLASGEMPSSNETQVTVKEEKKTLPEDRYVRPVQKDYRFTIQAGAFGKMENAQSLKNEFEEAGYEVELKEKTVGGSIFHIVLVGKFVDDREAKSFLDVLARQYNVDGRIVPLGDK